MIRTALKTTAKNGVVWIVFVFLLSAVLFSAVSVFEQIAQVRRADSDNIGWNLAQTEVEYLQFRLSLEAMQARLAPEKDLDVEQRLAELRRHFDVFYSRIRTISESPLYSELREHPRSRQSFADVEAYLDRSLRWIDGEDAVLLGALTEFTRETRAVGQSVRDMSLSGVSVSSQNAENSRYRVRSALFIVATTTILFFLALLGLITVIWRASRSLRRSVNEKELTRARLATVISTSPIPIVVSDDRMRVIEYNHASEDVFGYTRDEAIGAEVSKLIVPPDLREAHKAGVQRYFKDGTTSLIGTSGNRSRALRSDGTEFPVEISLSTGMGPEGRIFVAYMRDLTVDLRQERELLEAHDVALAGERAKERLLNTMSHEMRTPLHGILAALELMGQARVSEGQKTYLRVIENAAKTLLHHVNNVLQVASDTSHQLRVEPSAYDLHELISDVIEEQRILAAKNGNALILRTFPKALGRVEGDAHLLRQVLVNLLMNAAKFTHNGTVALDVFLREATGELEFRVQDDGVGIASDVQEQIFEDFFTEDASFSRLSYGTGLGLGITRRIIDAMQGKIGFTSTLGEGSTFWFRIPYKGAAGAAAEAEDTGHAAGQGGGEMAPSRALDVLVIEDNDINRLVIGDALAAANINVTMACDGLEGTELAARQRFDCILMDISMPGMSGVEALRHIREGDGLSKDTPVFAVTAHVFGADRKRFLEAGFDRVIAKPYSFKALVGEILAAACDGGPSSSVPGAGEQGLVDPSQVDEMRRTFGRSRTLTLLESLLEDGGASLEKVASLVNREETDIEAVASELHRFKGAAAIFGASSLVEALQMLETQARKRGTTPSPEQLEDISVRLKACFEALTQVAEGAE
jgi:PAS domain S-box-containing protein